MAIVAALLLLAVVSVLLFIRSWRRAGAQVRAAQRADRSMPTRQLPGHVSKTRGLAGGDQRSRRR